MEEKKIFKKTLLICLIFSIINMGLVQGKVNDITKENINQPLSYEGYTPYLQVVLVDETKSFTPTDDTYIANLDPSEINGDLTYLATRNRYGAGSDAWECDILIKFDLTSIPPSTPVLSASLNLYYYDWGDSNPAGRPLTAYKITSDWDEMTVNYNTQPSKASEVSASKNIPSSVGVGMKWDLTADVQQCIDNPESNFGWEIMDETYWGWYDVPAAYFTPKESLGGDENTPPDRPSVTGPSQGKTGVSYSFEIGTIDADGNEVYYYIDWGDNSNSGWVGPFTTKGKLTQKHTWFETGVHVVKVKAKDSFDSESDWGSLDVTVPKDFIPTSFFMRIVEKILERFPQAFHLLYLLFDQ